MHMKKLPQNPVEIASTVFPNALSIGRRSKRRFLSRYARQRVWAMSPCIPSKAIHQHFSLQRMRYPIEKWAQRCNLLYNMPENHWRSEAAASLCQTESANGLRIDALGLTRVFLKFSRFGAVKPPRAIVRHGVPRAGRPGTIPLQASSPPAPVWLRSTLRRDASSPNCAAKNPFHTYPF